MLVFASRDYRSLYNKETHSQNCVSRKSKPDQSSFESQISAILPCTTSPRPLIPPHHVSLLVLFSTSRRSVAPPSAPRISLLGKLGHLRWHLRRPVEPEARAKRRAAKRRAATLEGGVKQPFVGGLGGASHVGGLVGRMRNGILYGVHLV